MIAGASPENLAAELKSFEAAARRMQGWQFEYLPEVINGDVPWHYESLASGLVQQARTVVDLGTGGGEAFSKVIGAAHCEAYATEQWGPNAPVAASHLAGSAPVVRCSSIQLPFPSHFFDVVLARHEAIDPLEIARVLKAGGCFLSQQVINDFMFELGDYFSDTVVFPDFFNDYQTGFAALGLQVTRAEAFRYKIRFKALGHLVYQIVAAPWTIPGFSVDTHLQGLSRLHEKLINGGDLIFSAGYYLLEVKDLR